MFNTQFIIYMQVMDNSIILHLFYFGFVEGLFGVYIVDYWNYCMEVVIGFDFEVCFVVDYIHSYFYFDYCYLHIDFVDFVDYNFDILLNFDFDIGSLVDFDIVVVDFGTYFDIDHIGFGFDIEDIGIDLYYFHQL